MSAAHGNEKGVHAPTNPPHESYDAASPTSSVSLEKDVAIGLVGEHARDIDPAVEAKVLRKIDWFLIPAMIVGMYRRSSTVCKVVTDSYFQVMA